MMNIDCQIRNKSSIHEALSSMCEDEIMEGDNRVLCDRCKVKTNTVLRTAINALPDMLILSLKRFDLDYTTFETVKLNNRCEFGEELNMKRYTLEAKELLEAAGGAATDGGGNGADSSAVSMEEKSEAGSMMDVEPEEEKAGPSSDSQNEEEDPLSILPDVDYEYRLAGVLIHAGVAQGGHYYSFIKERSPEDSSSPSSPSSPSTNKWYRFDDEDVTPFDPSAIERECFGGKVKKETKYPNGNSHTVESEQFANALMLFYEKVKPLEFDPAKEEENDKSSPREEDADEAMEELKERPNNVVAPSTTPNLANLDLSNGYDVFLPEVKKSNSTHSWQSFLLTDEFQKFVRELLDTWTKKDDGNNSMDITPIPSPVPTSPTAASANGGGNSIPPWQMKVIRTSLSFVFDILFHLSLSKATLETWSRTLLELFSSHSDIAVMFVNELAMRTRLVNENWVRAYVMECTEVNSRRAALDIFVRAIVTTLLRRPNEQTLLQNWTGAWNAQSSECEALLREAMNQRRSREVRKSDLPMPMKLQGQHRQLEDVENVGVSATGVGIILSSLVQLIEVSPRYTQGNDLYYFVRELSNVGGGNAHSPSNYYSDAEAAVGKLLRDAMTEAQFIPRLMCLIIDEDILKHVFPGASASADVVEAISRNETQPASTNIMQMNSQMNSSHHNNTEQDNKAASATMLLEAIGCILGMLYVQRFPVSYETGDVHRGRSTRALTPRAVEALTTIFEESKPQNSSGLTTRDVHRYFQRCSHNVPPQRIEQIFARHGVDAEELAEAEGGQQQKITNRLLKLKGFLSYYTETVQNLECQVRRRRVSILLFS